MHVDVARKPGIKTAKRPTLSEIGQEAKRIALLAELVAQDWNLTAVAHELGLTNASNVVRAIRVLGLEDEYDAAKARGDIVQGRRADQKSD